MCLGDQVLSVLSAPEMQPVSAKEKDNVNAANPGFKTVTFSQLRLYSSGAQNGGCSAFSGVEQQNI